MQAQNYFDGLGRIWLDAQTGPDAADVIRRDRSFDERGNLASETLPFYEADRLLRRPTATTGSTG